MFAINEHKGLEAIKLLIEKYSKSQISTARKICSDLKYAFYTHIEQAKDFLALEVIEEQKLIGLVALLFKNSGLNINLGEKRIACLPFNGLQILTIANSMNDDYCIYDAVFSFISKFNQSFDALMLYEENFNSSLSKYLRNKNIVLNNFNIYLPRGSSTHYLIKLPNSGEKYLSSLGQNLRSSIKRAIKQINKKTNRLELRKFSTINEIKEFLELGESISMNTYQETLLKKGLRNSESLFKKLVLLGGENWFRSYILFAASTPIAFMYSHQFNGVYITVITGYDNKWKKYSPGIILSYYIILDLINDTSVHQYDFGGGSSQYKKQFSNDFFQETDIFLMRKSFYCFLICFIHNLCKKINLYIKNILIHLKLKDIIKKFMRNHA